MYIFVDNMPKTLNYTVKSIFDIWLSKKSKKILDILISKLDISFSNKIFKSTHEN